jgi:DNA-binding MarR family transcriptional regulator
MLMGGGAMSAHPDPDTLDPESPGGQSLDAEIADAFAEVFGQMVEHLEALARRLSLPVLCIKALHMLDVPMAMKELGQRFHCDPSFVTAIADLLDSHGLGKRETDPRDRRIRQLLLTPKGRELRARVERELLGRAPWALTLDLDERKCLLSLLRKMAGAKRAGEVTDELSPAAPRGG